MYLALAVATFFAVDPPARSASQQPGVVPILSASLADKPLQVGRSYNITINLTLPEGWLASTAGLPNAILQIDVPDGAELEGHVLTEYKELAANEFLQAPFERLVEAGETIIPFTLRKDPSGGARFGLNLAAYIRHGDDEDAYFIRTRVDLPLSAGAEGEVVDSAVTDWGADSHGTLRVGDVADPFTLPQADGTLISLADFKGEKNVLVTTYRAFW